MSIREKLKSWGNFSIKDMQVWCGYSLTAFTVFKRGIGKGAANMLFSKILSVKYRYLHFPLFMCIWFCLNFGICHVSMHLSVKSILICLLVTTSIHLYQVCTQFYPWFCIVLFVFFLLLCKDNLFISNNILCKLCVLQISSCSLWLIFSFAL
jgi:hypothetical protein